MLITFERKVPQSSYTSQNDHKSKGYPSKTSAAAFTMQKSDKGNLRPWASAFEIDFQKSYFPALVVYHPDCISRCLLWQGEMMMNQNPILNFLTLQIAAYAWWPRVGRYKQRETVALFFWEAPVAVNTISRATYLDSSSIPAVPKRLVLSMMEGRFNIKVVM